MIEILIVNENRLLCNLISTVLEDEKDIRVIGSATTVEQAIHIVATVHVDILLTSIHLPDEHTLDLVQQVRNIAPDTNILVLGISESREQVLPYVEAGAAGYVTKDSSVEDLVSIIKATYQGKAVISSEITAALISRLTHYARMFADIDSNVIEDAGLTPREIDVLELLGQNLTNQEISEYLYIEVGTVKNHVHSILNKLDVNSRKEASTFLALINKKPAK